MRWDLPTSKSTLSCLFSEPCVPFHLSAKYSLTIGQVLWDVSQGATLYSAEAVTEEGHLISCNTSDTYCALYNMACSQVYNVTVTAHNNICQGMATSKSINLKTGESLSPSYDTT